MNLQSILDTIADFRYRIRKRSLESRLIKADLRGQKKKAEHLQRELNRLFYARVEYLSGRITRRCKLYVVK